ncbi:MAG: hypothetical protein HY866_18950, partial [Chloroflexi bacterium]|nr:hypothetical protein [Chloroflexota bacterium]
MLPSDIPITTWTVIIVDDDPDNLTIPKEMLTFLGAQVHTAENGVEGMELLA